MMRKEQGFSILELMVGMMIATIVGSMINGYFTKVELDRRKGQAIENGQQVINQLLSRIQKTSERKSKSGLEVSDNSLKFSYESYETGNVSISIVNGCRQLDNEFAIYHANQNSQDCYEQLKCDGVPFVEIVEDVEDGIVKRSPSDSSYQSLSKKKISLGGVGLCFKKAGAEVEVTGIYNIILRHDKRSKIQNYSENLVLLDLKRNGISLLK